ncbi:MAG: hypothetical protein FJZ90_05675 [Chloroflexi bacterium]|nr:hypothetical protein [Chloroflexota bacterium]
MMLRRVTLLLLVVVLALTTAACGARKKVQEAAEKVVETAVEKVAPKVETRAAEPTPTPRPTVAEPTATQPPAEEEAAQEAPEAVELIGFLDSFRLYVRYQLTQEGEVYQAEHWMDVVKDPPARRIQTRFTDEDGEEMTSEWIQIGDTVYARPAGDDWIATSDTSGFIGPEELVGLARGYQFSRIPDCQDLGLDTVNGMQARHYRCDESSPLWQAAAEMPELIEGQMDAWVSTQYKEAIKVVSRYKVKDTEGEISEVEMTLEYRDINMPIEISAPEGVQLSLPEDIPLMEGAKLTAAMGPMIAMMAPKPPQEVSEFYIAAMQENGWTYQADESMPPMMHSFVKGERKASVMIMEMEGGSNVTVMTGEPDLP